MNAARQNELQPLKLAQLIAALRYLRLKAGNEHEPLGKELHMPSSEAAARFIGERQIKAVAVHKILEVAAVGFDHREREIRAVSRHVGSEVLEEERRYRGADADNSLAVHLRKSLLQFQIQIVQPVEIFGRARQKETTLLRGLCAAAIASDQLECDLTLPQQVLSRRSGLRDANIVRSMRKAAVLAHSNEIAEQLHVDDIVRRHLN